MTNQTSNEEIEAILFGVILGDEHTNRNKPSKHPTWHDKHLSVSEAHQAIATLLVKARIDELVFVERVTERIPANGSTMFIQEELDKRYDELTPKEKSGE